MLLLMCCVCGASFELLEASFEAEDFDPLVLLAPGLSGVRRCAFLVPTCFNT